MEIRAGRRNLVGGLVFAPSTQFGLKAASCLEHMYYVSVAASGPQQQCQGGSLPHQTRLHDYLALSLQRRLLAICDRSPIQLTPGATMLSRQLLTRRLPQAATVSRFAVPRAAFSEARALRATVEDEDPHLNGNYPNPPAIKRQFRDPNAQWWDKQERRNFGEPIHEDNDILGVFSPEQYTHVTSKKALLSVGTFVVGFLGFCGIVSLYYPDKPSTPRTFPDGLEKELGGSEAVPARKAGEDTW